MTDPAILSRIIKTLDRAPVVEQLEDKLTHQVGRPRRLTIKALLTAMCAAAWDTPFTLKRTRMILNNLPSGIAHQLRIEPPFTYRQVEYLFNRLIAAVDPSVPSGDVVYG